MENAKSPLLFRVDLAIKEAPHVLGRPVQIEADKDTVIVRGRVETYYQKQMAQELLRRVEGVQRVDNQLEVACY